VRESSAHDRAAKQFARALATLLQGRRIEHKMDRVVLVAEPHMLGLIKGELDDVTRGLVIQTIGKDLHAASEQVVFEHVKTISPVPPLSSEGGPWPPAARFATAPPAAFGALASLA
jgi:protein required for attachment to host cells